MSDPSLNSHHPSQVPPMPFVHGTKPPPRLPPPPPPPPTSPPPTSRSSMARPLPQGKFSRFQTHSTSKATIRTVWSKLPKATPLPPSAPSPIIN
ncbi:unnamed protein product [Dovyalis caffra]|uniref:Uncharacterized protein n=1 Tax=Dovyalis caffra TaxID=77055 RepID=A0AAV1SHW4_9ROSI|nr:unnamed protein product [Dovyalis caffra]